MVLGTLIVAQNLLEARDRNKKIKEKCEEIGNTWKKAKAIANAFHINNNHEEMKDW